MILSGCGKHEPNRELPASALLTADEWRRRQLGLSHRRIVRAYTFWVSAADAEVAQGDTRDISLSTEFIVDTNHSAAVGGVVAREHSLQVYSNHSAWQLLDDARLARYMLIPYWSPWSCAEWTAARLEQLRHRQRPLLLSFVGCVPPNLTQGTTPAYGARRLFRQTFHDNSSAHLSPRVKLFDPFCEHGRSDKLRIRARGVDELIADVYKDSEFCLVLGGDSTGSSRLIDVILHACIPVIINMAFPLYFEDDIPYDDFVVFAPIRSQPQLLALVSRLDAMPAEARLARRQLMARAVPKLLYHASCPNNALHMIVKRLAPLQPDTGIEPVPDERNPIWRDHQHMLHRLEMQSTDNYVLGRIKERKRLKMDALPHLIPIPPVPFFIRRLWRNHFAPPLIVAVMMTGYGAWLQLCSGVVKWRSAEFIVASAVFALALASLLMIVAAGGGGVEPSYVPRDATAPQLEQAKERARRAANSGVSQHRNHYRHAVRWCEPCARFKPPRAHHCRLCNACTARLDHHCDLANTCIGRRNHKHFILWLVYLSALLLYVAGVVVRRVLLDARALSAADLVALALLLVLHYALFGVSIAITLIQSLALAVTNTTRIEVWEKHWARTDTDGAFVDPYQKPRVLDNLREIMGDSVWCWPLPLPVQWTHASGEAASYAPLLSATPLAV